MAERIYILDGDNLEPMEEQRFALEDDLQKLLAKRPDLLDGERVSPGNPRRWLLVKREMGVPDGAGESDRWSLDHLLVDQDAVPTLVEVKLGSNSEARRQVVGQMLDYAANASLFWDAGTLRRSFKETWRDGADEALHSLLQPGGEEVDEEAFWGEVATNLAAKNLRLLFVADAIPIELARIVEFLNAQMRDNIEVLAVEVKQFKSKAETRSVLTPNVIGHTAAPPTKRGASGPNLTREAYLAEFTNPVARDTAERLIRVAEDTEGATLNYGKSSISIRGTCPLWQNGRNPISIAWLYRPMDMGDEGREFFFGMENISGWEGTHDERLTEFLNQYAQLFADDNQAKSWQTKGGSPQWAFKQEHVTEELAAEWAKRVGDALDGLRSLTAD